MSDITDDEKQEEDTDDSIKKNLNLAKVAMVLLEKDKDLANVQVGRAPLILDIKSEKSGQFDDVQKEQSTEMVLEHSRPEVITVEYGGGGMPVNMETDSRIQFAAEVAAIVAI